MGPATRLTHAVVTTVTALAVVLFSTIATRALFVAPVIPEIEVSEASAEESDVPQSETIKVSPQPEAPFSLNIPSLDVHASVVRVGINEKGNMGTPKTFHQAWWYKYGPLPGEKGNSVIAGHVNNGLGLSGVFARLHKLRRGDDIFVVYNDGTKLRFVVTEYASFPQEDVPLAQIFNTRGNAHLVLITCTGEYLPTQRAYTERLVVFARLVV